MDTDKKMRELQKTAAELQDALTLAVLQTGKLISNLQQAVETRNMQSLNILSTQTKFRILQYGSLLERMERTDEDINLLEEQSGVEKGSVSATRIMLAQMTQQAMMEQKNLEQIGAEIEKWQVAAEAGNIIEKAVLLDKISKALKESRD